MGESQESKSQTHKKPQPKISKNKRVQLDIDHSKANLTTFHGKHKFEPDSSDSKNDLKRSTAKRSSRKERVNYVVSSSSASEPGSSESEFNPDSEEESNDEDEEGPIDEDEMEHDKLEKSEKEPDTSYLKSYTESKTQLTKRRPLIVVSSENYDGNRKRSCCPYCKDIKLFSRLDDHLVNIHSKNETVKKIINLQTAEKNQKERKISVSI